MLFKRELKRNLKSFLVISLVCAALALYVIALAPSFGADIQKILDLKLPGSMQAAMGMKGLDFKSPISFYAIVFSYIYLFLSIYIANIFATIVSKEYSEKTAEYLYSLPAARISIILTKLSVALLYSLLVIIFIFVVSWIAFAIIIKDNYALQPVLIMSLAWLLGGLTFGSAGFLISSFLTKTRSASALSVGVVLFMYLLQIVIALNDKAESLKYISPFDWFKGSEIAKTGEISVIYCIIAVAVVIICSATGIFRFRKMDVLI